jgi:sulfide dehydrogenase cytochrome subunit
MFVPALALVGAIALPACQTGPGKAEAPKAAAPAKPVLIPRAEPISAAAAANMGNNCFSCHGPEGRSPGAIPSLHGKSAETIVKSLNDFKSGARPSTVMGRHAKGYTDAEIAAIANYISSFK